jgi:hypothetical protein
MDDNKLRTFLGLLGLIAFFNLASWWTLLKLVPQSEVKVVENGSIASRPCPTSASPRGMNKLGEAGWELVAARRASGADERMSYEMIFKRRKLRP